MTLNELGLPRLGFGLPTRPRSMRSQEIFSQEQVDRADKVHGVTTPIVGAMPQPAAEVPARVAQPCGTVKVRRTW